MMIMAAIHATAIMVLMSATGIQMVDSQDEYTAQRARMIREQIKLRGIRDERVLAAFQEVERHRFVPERYRNAAYGDFPLPIDEGQTISQPYIVAYMTEILNLKKDDRILEIGTGSGYQAAILSRICDTVYTVEIFQTLATKARKLFDELGYNNIMVKAGDGYEGWPEKAPFDAILVTCAPSKVPDPLKNQLAEGGRIIIPVGVSPYQDLVLLKKKGGRITQNKVLPVRFVPMIGKNGNKY